MFIVTWSGAMLTETDMYGSSHLPSPYARTPVSGDIRQLLQRWLGIELDIDRMQRLRGRPVVSTGKQNSSQDDDDSRGRYCCCVGRDALGHLQIGALPCLVTKKGAAKRFVVVTRRSIAYPLRRFMHSVAVRYEALIVSRETDTLAERNVSRGRRGPRLHPLFQPAELITHPLAEESPYGPAHCGVQCLDTFKKTFRRHIWWPQCFT
jgi:hypothetical protein